MDEMKKKEHSESMSKEHATMPSAGPRMLKSRGMKPGEWAVGHMEHNSPGHESSATEQMSQDNDGSSKHSEAQDGRRKPHLR